MSNQNVEERRKNADDAGAHVNRAVVQSEEQFLRNKKDLGLVFERIIRRELSMTGDKDYMNSEHLKSLVFSVYDEDPDRLFRLLEKIAWDQFFSIQQDLLNKQHHNGFNSPQLASSCIQWLLDYYSNLCESLPSLLYLLKSLECDLRKEVEQIIKATFHDVVFTDCCDVVAQLCQVCSSSDYDLMKRFLALRQELDEISRAWKAAKDHLNHQQDAHYKLEERRAQIKADEESKEAGVSGTPVKRKKVECLYSSETSGWFIRTLIFFSVAVCVSCQQQQLTSIPSVERIFCPGEEIIFNCTIQNLPMTSIVLSWRSDEYFGNSQLLQFTSDTKPGENRTSMIKENVTATLTLNSNSAGVRMMESLLRIIADQASNVTCEVTDRDPLTTEFSVSVLPGVPQRMNATQLSDHKCTILVMWDPPANKNGSDVNHYIVHVPSRNTPDVMVWSTFTNLTLLDCVGDIRIQVSAVNQFGCMGPNVEMLLSLLNMLPPTTTEGDSTTTAEAKPSTPSNRVHIIIGGSVGAIVFVGIVIVGIVIVVIIAIACIKKRSGKQHAKDSKQKYMNKEDEEAALSNGSCQLCQSSGAE